MLDLHAMFDDEFSETLSKDEFINGMFRLVFNNEFQRDCCVTLQIARLRQQVHDHFREFRRDLQGLMAGAAAGAPLEGSHVLPEDPTLHGVNPEIFLEAELPSHRPGVPAHVANLPGHTSSSSWPDQAFATLHDVCAQVNTLTCTTSELMMLQAMPSEMKALREVLSHLPRQIEEALKAPESTSTMRPAVSDSLEALVRNGQREIEDGLSSLKESLISLENQLFSAQGRNRADGTLIERATTSDSYDSARPKTMFTTKKLLIGQRAAPLASSNVRNKVVVA